MKQPARLCNKNMDILQEADYEYPEWENLCSGVCNTTCLTTSYFLAAKLEYETVIESVTVAALTKSVSFTALLSNTTRFLPSPITWRACTHQKGKTLLLCQIRYVCIRMILTFIDLYIPLIQLMLKQYDYVLASQLSAGSDETGQCSNMSIFTHTFNCHLTVATYIAIYAINETQISTSGVYTNYYRGYKYPSSCPAIRYGPACLYECNCDPEYCHIVLGCTDSDPSAALSAAELSVTM